MQARFAFSFLSAADLSLSAEDSRVFQSIQQLHKPAWQLSSSRFRGACETAQILVPKRISGITLNIFRIPLAWYLVAVKPLYAAVSHHRKLFRSFLYTKKRGVCKDKHSISWGWHRNIQTTHWKTPDLDLRDFKTNQSKKPVPAMVLCHFSFCETPKTTNASELVRMSKQMQREFSEAAKVKWQ